MQQGAFPSTEKPNGNKQQWIDKVGTWRYFALILADFDPVRADAIMGYPESTIAQAFVSRTCYNYSEK